MAEETEGTQSIPQPPHDPLAIGKRGSVGYGREVREACVQAVLAGERIVDIANRHHVPRDRIDKWMAAHNKHLSTSELYEQWVRRKGYAPADAIPERTERMPKASAGRGKKKGDGSITRRVLLSDLYIRTKDKKLVRFKPNEVQCLYLDQLCPGWRVGDMRLEGFREIILKARQFGFSTLILALIFLDTINNDSTNSVIIAHDAASTGKLFRVIRTFWQHLPDELKPPTTYETKNEFVWEDRGSSITVGTAGTTEFGRGSTVHNVHASEVAFWRNAEDLVAGLLQAVPEGGNVWVESTANGLGNWYHSEYDSAENGLDSVFTPRFYAWHQHPEYQDKRAAGWTEPTDDEKSLMESLGLSVAQIAWRRRKLKELRGKFPQEYPATPREAFISSGNPYFDRDQLMILEREAVTPDPADPPGDRLRAHRSKLRVWEPPQPGARYVIGADTAEGVTDVGDPDYDSAHVIHCQTWEVVAHLHGRWDTHEFALMLAELGTWFNSALIAVERNHHGHAVLNSLLNSAYYPRATRSNPSGVYYHEEYDEVRKREKIMKPGWPTTARSKAFCLDNLAKNLTNDELKLRCPDTIKELLRYIHLPGGRAGGESGSHDDRVMSLAIANAMLMLRPRQMTYSTRSFVKRGGYA